MDFPIGDPFSIRSFLLASAQTFPLFENDLMDTCKRSKELNYDFTVRIWSAEHFNFKRLSVKRELIWKKKLYENGEQSIRF